MAMELLALCAAQCQQAALAPTPPPKFLFASRAVLPRKFCGKSIHTYPSRAAGRGSQKNFRVDTRGKVWYNGPMLEQRGKLEEDGFTRIESPCAPSGIYCLLRDGVVVYVGKSKSVYARIAQHHNTRRQSKRTAAQRWRTEAELAALEVGFDEVWILFCPVIELERLELEYIDRFKPKWNIQLREPLPNIKVDIKALAAQMNWDFKRKEVDGFRRRKGL